MSHTQGKVKYQEESDAYTHIIRGDGGRMIAYAPQGSNGTDEANARRLVACWNLLLPFTTEEIEAGIDLEKLVRENAALKDENDALNEKLESREDQMETVGSIERELRNELARLQAKNTTLKSENEKLREAIQNFLDTCEATNPLLNGPTFVAIDALHAVMEGK